ncbi:MAG TPA: M48 family metalloprotease [Bryobacteraceae bacterium]|nr:M48 family metalloprotease [Bryobacteraceae bacterium]
MLRYLVAFVLIAGAGLTWVGRPGRDVSLASVGELWGDVFRDADSFGLQLSRLSAAEEMELGKKIGGSMVRGNATVPMWEVYVNAVGQSLAKHALRRGIQYEFHVLDAPVRNAFAIPGGHVFVYTGLLQEIKSEAELAAVLAHEIAHVDTRHCIERFQYQIRLKQLGLGDVGALVNLARSIIHVGYAQYQELEADTEGLRMTIAAGYDPQASVDLFARIFQSPGRVRNPASPLEEMVEVTGSIFTDYLRSHPPTPERMRRLRAQIHSYRKTHEGSRTYRGVENFRRKIAKSQQEFPGEYIRF